MKSFVSVILSLTLCASLNSMDTINKTIVWVAEKGKDNWYGIGPAVKKELEENQKVDHLSPHGLRRCDRAIESYMDYYKDAKSLQGLIVLYEKNGIFSKLAEPTIRKTHKFIIDESINSNDEPSLISWLAFCKNHNINIVPTEASKIKSYFRECKKNITAQTMTSFTEGFKKVLALKKLELEALSLGAKATDNESDEDDYTDQDNFYCVMTKRPQKLRDLNNNKNNKKN